MTLNWRYIYPFSTAGAYFIRRRTFEEEHSKKNIVDELWTI